MIQIRTRLDADKDAKRAIRLPTLGDKSLKNKIKTVKTHIREFFKIKK